MIRRSVAVVVISLLLISMFVLVFDVSRVHAITVESNGDFSALESTPPGLSIVFHQDFDNETTGTTPKDWNVLEPKFGNFTIDETMHYGDKGKSAKIMDNSTEGYPHPYRYFAQQRGIFVVALAIMLTNNTGNRTNLGVYIDDDYSNGASIMFMEDGTIQYRERPGELVPIATYIPKRWYVLKLVINVPDNSYDIHIDDHLEATNVKFIGACAQLHRILIDGGSAFWQPVGYIDNVEVRKCVEVPKDFSTIQEGIDAANPGDTVFVDKGRVYFETVLIEKEIWLVGEESNTTIIDGHFMSPEGGFRPIVTIAHCSNVLMYGFTIRNAPDDSPCVFVNGSSNIVANSTIASGLNDGISIVGSWNSVANSIIRSNLKCGIRVTGSNSTIVDNLIESNLQCGILMAAGGDNLLRNNTIKDSVVGLKCDTGTSGNRIFQNRFIGNTAQAIENGRNLWDDGYPYKPDERKGGGNYWSDYICIDLYSGLSQEMRSPGCFASPDGICDEPYVINGSTKDNYPLFLIQEVTQDPINSSDIDYTTKVKVTARVLENVKIEEASLYAYFDLTPVNLAMNISGNRLNGTIPAEPYGTKVQYSVMARAYSAAWVNTTSYPISGPYVVQDKTPPVINGIVWDPSQPNENQTITVRANVTEPQFASQVDKVFLTIDVDGTRWTSEMNKSTGNEYRGVVFKRPGNITLYFNITAYDRAGNKREAGNMTLIKRLAELSINYRGNSDDPITIDFGVMSRDQTKADEALKIRNTGNETLRWVINMTDADSWLTLNQTIGETQPGREATIKITVNTGSLSNPCLYVGELAVKANGTVPKWAVVIRVLVRNMVIDDSWASSEMPNRCNVGSSQQYAFHVIWGHNSLDATNGTVTVANVKDPIVVDAQGWANFSYSFPNATIKIFKVEKVNFTYVYNGSTYFITSFTQKAPVRSTIWDRVNVTLSIADDRIDVGAPAGISWSNSLYEYDNSTFGGHPVFNDTLIHNDVGRWCITTSSIVDSKYNLTAFESNSVCCIWDRIRIIAKGIMHLQTYDGPVDRVWVIATYEYDNRLFKGPNGTLFLTVHENYGWMNQNTRTVVADDPMDWSAAKDIWEKVYVFDTPGVKTFNVSRVIDQVYGLTKIRDNSEPSEESPGGTWVTPAVVLTAVQTNQSETTRSVQTQIATDFWSYAWIPLIILVSAFALVMLLFMGKKPIVKLKIK